MGVDESTAFAVAITQRLCTFYLPPISGCSTAMAGPSWVRLAVRKQAVEVTRGLWRLESRVREREVLRLLWRARVVAGGGLVGAVEAPRAVLLELPRARAQEHAGPSPAPTNACRVSGGQCTKSHCLVVVPAPRRFRSASPERTRKSSCSVSQWYVSVGSPGFTTRIAIPSIGKNVSASYSSAPVSGTLCPRPG